jgi:hypothetical protein
VPTIVATLDRRADLRSSGQTIAVQMTVLPAGRSNVPTIVATLDRRADLRSSGQTIAAVMTGHRGDLSAGTMIVRAADALVVVEEDQAEAAVDQVVVAAVPSAAAVVLRADLASGPNAGTWGSSACPGPLRLSS